MDKLVFFNVGWMESYQGEETIDGGGEYVNEHGFGYEMYNFKEYKDKVYGYVAVGRIRNDDWKGKMKNMRIERLGASINAPSVDNITVIWVAKSPKEKDTRIVGWYRAATVYRSLINSPRELSYRKNKSGDLCSYNVVAQSTDAILVPANERTFLIPRGKECALGQCNVWYADKKENKDFVEKVRDYINGK
jgi:hypothetical protein